jgi:hypothetical protein
MATMKVFICIDHDGHWPVGVASVVAAQDEEQARELLAAELRTFGLKPERGFTLQALDLSAPRARVLNDGDY